MKTLSKILFLCGIIVVMAFSCEKENNNKDDCGCNGIIQYTISDTLPLEGKFGYTEQAGQDTLGEFSNKFWVSFTEPDCINCIQYYIVCNNEFLSSEIKTEALSGQIIDSVKFSGYVKETCQKIFAPADYTYNHIVLTKIERR